MKKIITKKIEFPSVRHVWSILCSSSSIDQQTNNLSLYNLLEEITLVKKEINEKKKEAKGPYLPILISFQLITLWEKIEPGLVESRAKIQLVDPEEKILIESEYDFKIEPHQEKTRYIANLNALPFTTDGMYQFRILLKMADGFKQVGTVGLKLKFGNSQ